MNRTKDDSETASAVRLATRLGRLLSGRPPQEQGVALADLLATWVAGHIVEDDPKETDALRATLLASHIDLVQRLVPVIAKHIHDQEDEA